MHFVPPAGLDRVRRQDGPGDRRQLRIRFRHLPGPGKAERARHFNGQRP